MIYQFKPGCHISGDAQAVGERLDLIRATGGLTPAAVVDDARNPDSVLHPLFDWSDKSAAHKWRMEQAGHVIRSVTVIVEDAAEQSEPTTIRAFLPIDFGDSRKSYVQTMTALNDVGMRQQVLAQAYSELGAVARKYRELKELTEVVSALDRVGDLLKQQTATAG